MMCMQSAASTMQPERNSAHVWYYRNIEEIEEVGNRACRFVLKDETELDC